MKLDGMRFEGRDWGSLRGAGSARTPEENLSLAAEVFIVHERRDEPCALGWADGLMVNRHLRPGRFIANRPLPGRDAPGEDETPAGAYVSLAAQPRGPDGLGGELPATGPDDTRTAHQREWDFLEQHVQAAYATYRGRPVTSLPALVQELSPWQKVEALARYAIQWKMRSMDVYPGFHPVDVLFHSSYCTGAANILHALAMVAGFDSRFIAITNHSTVEIRVNDCWVWADNIWPGGAVTPTTHTYAEITENPRAIACLTPAQHKVYGEPVARYRSPYHLAGRFYWHFCWGDGRGRGARADVPDGYGLSVPYDPSTAPALYPEARRHAFHVPAGWPAAVNVSEKGALVRARFDLVPGQALRKRFHVGPCADNPVAGGKARFRLSAAAPHGQAVCVLDGVLLRPAGNGVRYAQPTLDFDIPARLLTPGEHDLVIGATGGALPLVLYPDAVQPYDLPLLGADLRVPDSAFEQEPLLGAAELNALREAF